MAKPIIIDGNFCCRNLTGVERYAFEICANLDPLIQKDQIWLYVPANAKHIPTYQNIKVVRSKKDCTSFPVWDHVHFSHFVGKNHGIALNFGNLTPLLHPGIVFIHDIYSVLHPEDFTSRRDKLVNLYDRMMYRHAAKHGKLVITVSDFSRKAIATQYHISKPYSQRNRSFRSSPVSRDMPISLRWEAFPSGRISNGLPNMRKSIRTSNLSFQVKRYQDLSLTH